MELRPEILRALARAVLVRGVGGQLKGLEQRTQGVQLMTLNHPYKQLC